jgi:AcrR family transcriptional regulator
MSDDVREEIMAATYRALCEHGYADLTMQDIADETDRSKATLHYHYDGKRDLLLAFLDYLHGSFTDRVDDPAGETPAERLESFVDAVLTPTESDERTREAFGTAALELKAQAPYDEAVRDRLRAFDEFLFDRIRDLVVAGVEAGEFRDVAPDDTARFLVTAIDGARTKQVAIGQDVTCTRRMIHAYVRTHLVADDAGATGDDQEVPE